MAASLRAVPAPTATVRVAWAIDGGVLWFARHWPASLLALMAPIVVLPIVAPLLESAGYHHAAGALYFLDGLVCHQNPARSFQLRGEPFAICQRDFAIFTTALVALTAFAVAPRLRAVRPATIRPALLLSIPLALDGTTQLFGLRESTWELRCLTGVLFSLGWSWYVFPRLQAGFQDVIAAIDTRHAASVRR